MRELLLNSVKHAVGSAVHIMMQHRRPDKVRIIVADAGLDPASLDDKRTGPRTFGLLNIRERISSFGGEFHIDSGPKRGTQITLSLPRDPTGQIKSTDRAKRLRRRRTLPTGSLKRDQIPPMAIRASG